MSGEFASPLRNLRAVFGAALLALALASCSSISLDQIGFGDSANSQPDPIADTLPPARA
jgi:hypothetical protein